MNSQKRILELRDMILYHNQKYHVEDSPEISDYAYDQLFEELKHLEKLYPEYITPESPTQKLQVVIQKELGENTHLYPLRSLENTYNADELRAFDERVKKFGECAPDHVVEYVVTPKYDGLSIALLYENGQFDRATTRGNGEIGENVTANVKTIASVPLVLRDAPKMIQLRGEVIMTKDAFSRLNTKRIEDGDPLFANPRNAASGSLRQLDTSITASRKLDIICYDMRCFGEDIPAFLTYDEQWDAMKRYGIKTTEYQICADIEDVISYVHEHEQKRNDYPYEIDGLVISVRNTELRDRLGMTQHHPRGSVAYKFPAQEEITRVQDIIVQVGRTGVLTPVAVLEPVLVGGVTVSKASLHNMEDLCKKDVRKGDFVLIKRAGEVIPEVIKVLVDRRTGREVPFEVPTQCPVCAAHVVQLPEEVALRCSNLSCPSQVVERIAHFVSKDAMDIDGFGAKTVQVLYDSGLIKDFADIFLLKEKQQELIPVFYEEDKIEKIVKKGQLQDSLFSLEESQEEAISLKRLYNLLKSIEEAKEREIDRLIIGLGMKYVGKRTATLLCREITTIWDLTTYTVERLAQIEGIGPKIAESIADYLGQQENIFLLQRLESACVNFSRKEKIEHLSGPLSGKTFLFTGTLPTLSREEATRLVLNAGGRVVETISKQVNYLVAGEKAGSKLEKANKLGVHVINEDTLRDMLLLS